MPRPIPTPIGHFTHIEHLPTIATHGLLCDADQLTSGLLTSEAGEPGIKANRRHRPVHSDPGGVVADYVPFYFAPRSPMMFKISRGGVPSFVGDSHDLVYLMTTVERAIDLGLSLVFTDRNAALGYARHTDNVAELDSFIDWHLMRQSMWSSTADDPDRMERRMAECLIHENVPWVAFTSVVVYDDHRATRARELLDSVGTITPTITVRPGAYF